MTSVRRGGHGGERRATASVARRTAFSGAGHRAVAPDAVERQPEYGRALLGDLDRVQAARPDIDRDAAGLVDRHGCSDGIGLLEREVRRARQAAGLLVRRGREQTSRVSPGTGPRPDLARRHGPRPRGAHHLQLHRQEVLHVDRAAPVQPAFGDLGVEGVVGPAVARCGHDIEVRHQEEGLAAGTVPAEARGHGAAARHGLMDRRQDAGVLDAPAMYRAASSSAPGGSGGLMDGIRIRSWAWRSAGRARRPLLRRQPVRGERTRGCRPSRRCSGGSRARIPGAPPRRSWRRGGSGTAALRRVARGSGPRPSDVRRRKAPGARLGRPRRS